MSEDRLTATEFGRELLELLGRSTPFADGEQEGIPSAGIPTAYLVVVEWQGDDGRRWLSRVGGLGNGDKAPIWTVEMLAREALHWSDSR